MQRFIRSGHALSVYKMGGWALVSVLLGACTPIYALEPDAEGNEVAVDENEDKQEIPDATAGMDPSIDEPAADDDDSNVDGTGESEGSPADPIDPDAELAVQYDFDCIAIDNIRGPDIVPPAGMRLNFRVVDCDGDPVPPLDGTHIEVLNDEKGEVFGSGLEGGGVSDLGRPWSMQLSSVLALDMSDSIFRADAVNNVIDGALAYLDQIDNTASPGVAHEVSIVAFGRPEAYEVVSDFTLDRAKLRSDLEALRKSESRGSTDLYGAYVKSIERVSPRGASFDLREHFVVVLTDGTHEAGDEEAMRAAALETKAESTANFYAIGIPGYYDEARLLELASTPNNFFHVMDIDALEIAFRKIANRVDAIARSSYAVGICTPVSLGSPTLTIRVTMPNTKGETIVAEATLPYEVKALNGEISQCRANDIMDSVIQCSSSADFDGDGKLDRTCSLSCVGMKCGCDSGTVCGTCGSGEACSADNECIPESELPEGESGWTCGGSGEGFSGQPAVGIQLDGVRSFQALEVEIGREGRSIAQGDRDLSIVANKDLWLSAGWTLNDEWVAREVQAELTLVLPDGSSKFVSDVQYVAAVSLPNDFTERFSWHVDPEWIVPGTEYRIDAFEVSDRPEPVAPGSQVPHFPTGADVADLGVLATKNRVRIRFVPIRHQISGCTREPARIEDTVAMYRSYLERVYPVAQIELDVRSTPLVWTGSLDPNGWTTLVGQISQTRSIDAVDDDIFYHGVLNPCTSTYGIAGIGYLPPNAGARAAAPYRSSLGLEQGWTFLHELGHNLGRPHVACTGQEAGPDPSYPHAGARIGRTGFDWETTAPIDDVDANARRIAADAAQDFMSYCSDRWISDYGWNRLESVLTEIGSWSNAARTTRAARSKMLMGHIHPDGSANWWIHEGPSLGRSAESSGDFIRYRLPEGETMEVPAEFATLSEGGARVVYASLPTKALGASAISIHASPSSLHDHHHGVPVSDAPGREYSLSKLWAP